ncbi:uncharacterized protein MYCFIDRAFT_172198 [Pseudocercospora fijiensis CIRAD86]|uniref:Beta-lactamase-related domain-containing protein n=1 Tax=Pseudocercospora fijiensis (strain CIRAD86) TaxID=383855 RepID=M3BAV9_PSEFD|nr:uncharacterized protein MYCFIDRAFT_172198 [Pseudocercospora fijiensis CIRAD86]EME86447.1 hypothetical protein MYCFIDRAFT_172198 [Pseudocercospora fijiensis CIRAD86]
MFARNCCLWEMSGLSYFLASERDPIFFARPSVCTYIPFFYIETFASTKAGLNPTISFYMLPILSAGPLAVLSICTLAAGLLGFCWIAIAIEAGVAHYSQEHFITDDMGIVGGRLGMNTFCAALGLLIGTPIAGLQVFCGATLLLAGGLVVVTRKHKAVSNQESFLHHETSAAGVSATYTLGMLEYGTLLAEGSIPQAATFDPTMPARILSSLPTSLHQATQTALTSYFTMQVTRAAIAIALALASSALSTKPLLDQSFDSQAEELLRLLNVPGLSVAIVRGNDFESKGYGYARIPSAPATGDTLYYTGSTTKAFVATLAAMMVENNTHFKDLKWSTPLASLLEGDFALSEEYQSLHTTLEDALSHRSGLPRHDASYGWGNASMFENIRRMRHLPLTAEP